MHGWLVLDKPLNLTSAAAVGKVKRLLSSHRRGEESKIGHAGTLDPLASGILPLALGEATKTTQFMFDASKSYCFTVTWGESRDTDDAEGRVTGNSPVRPSKAALMAIIPRFTGTLLQAPPNYSAIKVSGERAYALARAGEQVELASREVRVDSLELIEFIDGISATFEVHCGKGFYIRSLARDMAHAVGTLGYVTYLRRLSVGKFSEKDAISLELLEEMVHKGLLAKVLRPVESVLDDIPAWEIDSALALRVRRGQPLIVPINLPVQAGLVRVRCADALVAIGRIEQGLMKSERVFNLGS